MKDILLVGLDKEERKKLELYHKEFEKVINRYIIVIKKMYLEKEKEQLEYCDSLSSYATKVAHINGYKAALLEMLKLHSFDLHELIPEKDE